jgi:hypothetical protein
MAIANTSFRHIELAPFPLLEVDDLPDFADEPLWRIAAGDEVCDADGLHALRLEDFDA